MLTKSMEQMNDGGLYQRLLVVKSKTICGAWHGKETATGREFEHLREKMQSTLKMMFY